MNELYPLRLQPLYKDYLWGGTRLRKLYQRADGPDTVAESWELSTLPGSESVIAAGPLAGRTLREVLGGEISVLVKFIDAASPLSVQVHPSDATADAAAGERGKAELWYVVDARPRSFLYCGFSRELSAGALRAAAAGGSILNALNKVPVRRGDVFFLRGGTVHALGAGVVVAEVQQSSNTTFRLYDYDRPDRDGKPRALQIDRGCAVAERTPGLPSAFRAGRQAGFAGFTLTELFSCGYFNTWRLDVSGSAALHCGGGFAHLLIVSGQGAICHGGRQYPFMAGSSWFLPAELGKYRVEGACRALLTRTGEI